MLLIHQQVVIIVYLSRVLTSGSAQDDSNYDNVHKGLWANGSFQNVVYNNQTSWSISGTGMDNNGTSESFNGVLYYLTSTMQVNIHLLLLRHL